MAPIKSFIRIWLDKYGSSLDWEAKAELKKAIELEFEKLLVVSQSFSKTIFEDSFASKNDE
ncbi:hypothetical protein JCM15765_15080 [Paradesulfitobacterium aromaticivorans]